MYTIFKDILREDLVKERKMSDEYVNIFIQFTTDHKIPLLMLMLLSEDLNLIKNITNPYE